MRERKEWVSNKHVGSFTVGQVGIFEFLVLKYDVVPFFLIDPHRNHHTGGLGP